MDDDGFVQHAFLQVLGRPVDADGRRHFVQQLASGLPREQFLGLLADSDEAKAHATIPRLPSLHRPWRRRFRTVATDDGVRVPVFHAVVERDYAWLERAILRNAFYERPGEWSLDDNDDKRAMAAVVARVLADRAGGASVLEIGCSSGAVLGHLVARGIDAVGVDLSAHARDRAAPHVRDRIVLGDVTATDLGRRFDAVVGLDVFEHVRPGRVDALLSATLRHLQPGGVVVANIPAFGLDPVFGEPFPMYVPSWRVDADAGRPFRDVLVDVDGYPLHGHLVWASARWWTERFAAHGLVRDRDAEWDVQRAFADHFSAAPSRRSLFVFR